MKILFVCEGNMMRSQMAEAFYNSLTNTHDATSAGAIATGDIHISSRAAEVMREYGIDTSAQHSKQVTSELADVADRLVFFPTKYMPEYITESPKSELWNVVDPHYHQEEGITLVRKVRDDIQSRVIELIEEVRKYENRDYEDKE
jgi:protein-tyrosine-phosphatase